MNQGAPLFMRPDLAEQFGGIGYGPDTDDRSGACLRELIRQRAYELFESRGRQSGHDLDDWLQAEHQIKQHLQLI
jgi:hypothetical protein